MPPREVTVGVSIVIPAPYDAPLRQWRHRSGDRLAGLISPHVTLIGPTALARESVEDVVDELRRICAATPAFWLKLRGTGSFRPVSDVVFVAVAEGIASCELLANQLMVEQLQAPRAYPYHPHVTVAQDVAPGALDEVFAGLEDFKADILVTEVWAHCQDDDGSWHPLACFELGRAAPPA